MLPVRIDHVCSTGNTCLSENVIKGGGGEGVGETRRGWERGRKRKRTILCIFYFIVKVHEAIYIHGEQSLHGPYSHCIALNLMLGVHSPAMA